MGLNAGFSRREVKTRCAVHTVTIKNRHGRYRVFGRSANKFFGQGSALQKTECRTRMKLDVTRAHWETVSATEQYKRSLFSLDKWKKVLRGGVNLRSVFNVVSARAVGVVKARLSRFAPKVKEDDRGAFAAEFEKLCNRGTDVFMVFSTKDPGLDYLNLHAKREIEALSGNPKFKFVEIGGPDHTFTPIWSQVDLEARIRERLAQI